MSKQTPRQIKTDAPHAQEWDRMTTSAWIDLLGLNPVASEQLARWLVTLMTADLSEVSLLQTLYLVRSAAACWECACSVRAATFRMRSSATSISISASALTRTGSSSARAFGSGVMCCRTRPPATCATRPRFAVSKTPASIRATSI